MNRTLLAAGLAALYLASGLFIVGGDEQGLVRRFGRAQPALRPSGLHYDLPWPLARVDRVNLNEVRTLSVPATLGTAIDADEFVPPEGTTSQSQYLTGDKNVLHVYASIQYRVSAAHVARYLYGSESPERHLRLLGEAAVADAVARSGVDYVHTLGLAELSDRLTRRLTELAEQHDLGLEIDQVTIDGVAPPVHVKAEFLDVSNARADRAKYVHDATAYAEQTLTAARGQAQQTRNAALSDRDRALSSSRGRAERFDSLVFQLRQAEQGSGQGYVAARQMALGRLYAETMRTILERAAVKVIVDGDGPIDLTLGQDDGER